MQKFILFLVTFFILAAANLFSQNIAMADNNSVQASGTYFSQSVKDSKWSNHNGSSYTKARYANYDGETFIKLSAQKTTGMILNFTVKVSKGELEVLFINSRNEILFQTTFYKSEQKNMEITLEKDENYQIKFIGKETKGAYFCQWIEK
jgi:hypothetical protein